MQNNNKKWHAYVACVGFLLMVLCAGSVTASQANWSGVGTYSELKTNWWQLGWGSCGSDAANDACAKTAAKSTLWVAQYVTQPTHFHGENPNPSSNSWTVFDLGTGYYLLRNNKLGLCAQAQGGSAASRYLGMATCNGGDSLQQFQIYDSSAGGAVGGMEIKSTEGGCWTQPAWAQAELYVRTTECGSWRSVFYFGGTYSTGSPAISQANWSGPGTYSDLKNNWKQLGDGGCGSSCAKSFAGSALWLAEYVTSTPVSFHGETSNPSGNSWTVTDVGSGYYTIRNNLTGKCASDQSSLPTQQYLKEAACNAADTLQHFKVYDVNTGGAVGGMEIRARDGSCWFQDAWSVSIHQQWLDQLYCGHWKAVYYFGGSYTGAGPGQFAISASTTALTCETLPVVVTPQYSDGSTFVGYSGTVTLTTSTGQGDWVIQVGGGSLSNGVANDGSATYTFSGAETQVVLGLKHAEAGTVDIDVAAGAVVESVGADPLISFVDAGFQVISGGASAIINTQIAGKESSVGHNAQALSLRAVKTDSATGVCTSALPTGVQSVEVAYECLSPNHCDAGSQMVVSNTAVVGNDSGSVSLYTSLPLNFDGAATAPIPLLFNDIGLVRLHFRKVTADSDDGPSVTLRGASNAFVVRPFGIGFTDIQDDSATPNPGATISAASDFVAAGSPFHYRIGLYGFAAADDGDGDGAPDAGVDVTNNALLTHVAGTVSFDVAQAHITPASGVVGGLGLTAVNLIAGEATQVTGQTYSEVGSIRISALLTDYLGTGAVTGVSPVIGRFKPYGFAVEGSSVVYPLAPTQTFAYMGQALNLSYVLKAVNATGDVVANYDASTLGYANPGSVNLVAENDNNGTDLSSRLSTPVGIWTNGYYVYGGTPNRYTSTSTLFDRGAVPDGPYQHLQLGLTVMGDLQGAEMHPGTATDCVALADCTAVKLGPPLDLRYGRIVVLAAAGPETSDLPIPLEVQYWDGAKASYTRSTEDDFTVYAGVGKVIAAGPVVSALDWVGATPSAVSPLAGGVFASGLSSGSPARAYYLQAPGAGNTGSVEVQFELDSAFGGGVVKGAMTFGSYRGSDRMIYWRERN